MIGKNNKKFYLIIIIISLIILLISCEYKKNFFNYSYIYENNIYSKERFNNILSICNSIRDEDMKPDPKAIDRMMYVFTKNKKLTPIIESLLFNKNFINKVRYFTGNNKLVP